MHGPRDTEPLVMISNKKHFKSVLKKSILNEFKDIYTDIQNLKLLTLKKQQPSMTRLSNNYAHLLTLSCVTCHHVLFPQMVP